MYRLNRLDYCYYLIGKELDNKSRLTFLEYDGVLRNVKEKFQEFFFIRLIDRELKRNFCSLK